MHLYLFQVSEVAYVIVVYGVTLVSRKQARLKCDEDFQSWRSINDEVIPLQCLFLLQLLERI